VTALTGSARRPPRATRSSSTWRTRSPEHKERARDEVIRAARRLDPARTVVRVNGTGTPWHDDDIAALMELPSTVVMLPMA
jgi:citrate lyase beta subunit